MKQPSLDLIYTRMSGFIPCLTECVKRAQGNAPLEQRMIIYMPENLTLDAEYELIHRLKVSGLLGISLYSPRIITYEVADCAGKSDVDAITDFGRAMVISHILKQLYREKELHFYEGAYRQASLPIRLAEQIDEFRDAGLTPQGLLEIAEDPAISQSLALKYKDISLIWQRYIEAIDQKFLDAHQQWADMLERLKLSGLLSDTNFIFCGFSTINRQHQQFLAAAARLAKSATVIAVADDTSADQRIFADINSQLLALHQYLFENGIAVRRIDYAAPITCSPGIQYLLNTLFSGRTKVSMPISGDVRLYTARTPFIECQYAAQTLISWHESGWKWRDMGVAWYAQDILPALLPMVLSQAGIPYTMPSGQSILMNDYVQYLLSTVRAACLGYPQQDMLRIVKSGFASLTEQEMMDFENFIIEKGITRGKWHKPFFIPENSPEKDRILAMEDLRILITDPLHALHDQLAQRRATGQDAARAIYNTMIDTGAYEVLRRREEDYMERGMMLEIDRDRQIWDAVNNVLDQIASVAKETHIPLEELPVLLESAFEAAKVKSLPQTSDAVQLNAPGHFIGTMRGLILMGMQDRDVPGKDTLITDTERDTFRRMTGTHFGRTRQEAAAAEMSYISNTLSLVSDQLLMTCSLSKPDGSVLMPGSVFTMTRNALQHSGGSDMITGGIQEDHITPYTPGLALERIAVLLRSAIEGDGDFLNPETEDENMRKWQQAFSFLHHSPDWHDRTVEMLNGIHAVVHADDLTSSQAKRIYPVTNLSISRLETFASCSYQHFVTYGLGAQVRQPFSFLSTMRGDFFHAVMEGYISRASRLPDWPELSAQQINAILDDVIRPLTDAWQDGPLDIDTARHYQAQQIVRDIRHAVLVVTRNFGRGQFYPSDFELRFGRADAKRKIDPIQFNLSDNTKIILNGQIDRLDLYKDPDSGITYFRVVDYKSSDHQLHQVLINAGLELQLPIYMNAYQQAFPGRFPAGGLYQKLTMGLVDAEDDDEATIFKKQGSDMKMKGIVLENEKIQGAMGEVNGKGKSQDLVTVISMDEMRSIMENSIETARTLSEDLFAGKIQINPVQYKEDTKSPCSYCSYKAICGIDARLPGGRPKILLPSKPEDESEDD